MNPPRRPNPPAPRSRPDSPMADPSESARPSVLYALGPEGTFSDQAARRLREATGHPSVAIHYTRTIPEVLVEVEGDARAWGVFPIENSVAGTVGQAQDGLVNHKVTIFREIAVPVRFSLLASAPLPDVRRFYAHPQAFDQCSEYLAAHLAQADVDFTRSNVESGLKFIEGAEQAPLAAIVPVDFGADYPAQLAAEDIQTYANNTTRFLAVRRRRDVEHHDFSLGKTSLMVEPDEDRPGLLYELLRIFHTHGLNICRLESRPAKIRPWVYVFFMDIDNNPNTEACLADLRQTPNTVHVLGSYDAVE